MSGEHFPRLYSADQVRELDLRAIQELQLSAYELMQRAAASCFEVIVRRWPEAQVIAVVCGPGNNGGDGYALARIAREAGMQVYVARTAPEPNGGAARSAFEAWQRSGGQTVEFDRAFAAGPMQQAQVICDAIFGIGLSRPVDGLAAQAIDAINARRDRCGVLAADLPSGLDADSGAVHGRAVIAHDTVSFVGRKRGLYLGQGPDHCGRRHFDDLGAARLDAPDDGIRLLNPADLRRGLRPRAASAHKGHHGHVLVVGGDHGMAGASLLAAQGALRSGAGLVSVATRAAHAPALVASQPEIMFHGVESASELAPLVERASVVLIGPGLGQGSWARELLQASLASAPCLVLDADALNLMAESPAAKRDADTILTPHPGEAARLLGMSTGQIQQDRLGAVQALRDRMGGVALLKGAGSLIAGQELWLCADGNPGMGVGGMGDVLGGVISAFKAQGLDLEQATALGVLAHALAGDLAAAERPRGLIPSDLLGMLRRVVNPGPA